MQVRRFSIGSALLASMLCTANVSATNHYTLDDGLPNTWLTYGIPADYCWFQSFTTVGTSDVITNVQLMFDPLSIPAGTPIRVCVWEDPNDDGDPGDAILVGQRAGTVPNVASPVFTTYTMLNPPTVHHGFFVGAFVSTDGSFGSIAPVDYNSPLSGRAYFATDGVGMFDPATLSSSFYNHIEVIGAEIHGVFVLRAEGSGLGPTTYCAAKVNSLGCLPQVQSIGTPSVSAGTGFFLQGTNVLNRSVGVLIYGTSGRDALPIFGGTLCVAAPQRRTPPQNSGGSLVGRDCTGVFNFDFGAWITTGADPSLTPGTTVNAQFYSRDGGFAVPNNVGLTNAIEFTLVP